MSTTSFTPGPLLTAAQNFQTVLWNDSSDLDELTQSISFGGVGATCNPVIAYTTISKHPDVWEPRIKAIADANPTWGESEIGWQAVKDMSVEAARLLAPAFEEHKGQWSPLRPNRSALPPRCQEARRSGRRVLRARTEYRREGSRHQGGH